MPVQAALACTSRAQRDCEQADNSSHRFCIGALVIFFVLQHTLHTKLSTQSQRKQNLSECYKKQNFVLDTREKHNE